MYSCVCYLICYSVQIVNIVFFFTLLLVGLIKKSPCLRLLLNFVQCCFSWILCKKYKKNCYWNFFSLILVILVCFDSVFCSLSGAIVEVELICRKYFRMMVVVYLCLYRHTTLLVDEGLLLPSMCLCRSIVCALYHSAMPFIHFTIVRVFVLKTPSLYSIALSIFPLDVVGIDKLLADIDSQSWRSYFVSH